MQVSISLTLPIYWQPPKKKRMQLIGLNTYERMHYQELNKLKTWFYALVRSKVGNAKITGQYSANYKLHYKNPSSDASNIISVIDKLLMDGLQKCRAVEEDSCKFYVGSSWEIVGQDKANPRVEVFIAKKD